MTLDGFLPTPRPRRRLWDLWESLLQIILQRDSHKSGWRCFSMCARYRSSCKSLPVLQGRQRCRAAVWVRELTAERRTTWEVWVGVSVVHWGCSSSVKNTMYFIKCGWDTVPRMWQIFMSEGISGDFRSNPVHAAGLTTPGQVAQALSWLSARDLQGQRLHHVSGGCPRAALLSQNRVFSSHPAPLATCAPGSSALPLGTSGKSVALSTL